MYRSAVRKLTLYYVLLLTALALVFSLTLYYIDHQEIAASLKSQVQKFDLDRDYGIDTQQIYQVILNARSRNFAIRVFYYDLGFIVVSIFIANLLAKQTLKPIRQAHEEQIKFIADASHQLKTPLANMQLAAELNLAKTNKVSKDTYISVLRQNVSDIRSLNLLTDSLLNIARHQSSLSQLDIQRADLKALIDECLQELASLASKHKINIKTDVHRTYVHVDKTAFKQVFLILIENAIKYSKTNSQIEITSLNEYRSVIVKIVDYGVGIKKSELKSIFKPFYRSTDSKLKDVEGFGLGLSLAKQITELHGGKITASSVVHEGSVFSVYIPRHVSSKNL